MKRLISFLFFTALFATPFADAGAQAPDVREVRPIVMLLVDTSGSMNWMETSSDSPNCSAGERNRFHLVQEAMTGSFSGRDWSCDRNLVPNGPNQNDDGILDVYLDRMVFGMMTFDSDYDLETTSGGMWSYGPPAAWDDGDDRNNVICSEGCTVPCRDECTRVCTPVCTRRNWRGQCTRWGESCSNSCVEVCGGTPVCGFGCRPANGDPRGADYINVGARNATATSGSLLSIGDGTTLTPEQQNANIQNSLLSIRPSGGTPIAGILSDLGWFMENDPDIVDDPFAECRGHYGILLSDGLPNTDRRTGCEGSGQSCPHLRPVDEAAALCELSSGGECTGILDGLYAIGMDLSSSNGLNFLNDIADVGGTEEAFFADDQASLISAFAAALDAISASSTSRTAPAFSGGGASSSDSASQFNAGFVVGGGDGGWSGKLERTRFECNADLESVPQAVEAQDRFHELLDRQGNRTLFTVVPSNDALYAEHLIGDIDDAPTPLPFESTVPPGNGGGNGNGRGNGGPSCSGGSPGGGNAGGGNNGGGNNGNNGGSSHAVEDGLSLEPFSLANGRVSADLLGVARDDRDAVINWVHGTSGRSNSMGAIYHSSPVVVGPPSMDIPDESYNLFRRREDVQNRPTVLYVGSSDGVLHAFVAEDWEDPNSGDSLTAGEELWGFVPPMLLQKLSLAMAGNQFMVDGTAVVRDIFYSREAGQDPDGDLYHTVLIMGMRGGADGYIALDVTDPRNPEFMWQFADSANMGATYGTPAMGQILVEVGGTAGQSEREERAIVLLPAGLTEDLESAGECGGPVDADGDGEFDAPLGCPSQGRGTPPVNAGTLNARDNQRCWDSRGRSLYFLDPATGELVTLLGDDVFNAPLTGGMALFTGDTGTIATRAFLTDADGMMWRIDFSDPDYTNWDAEPFFDLYHQKTTVGPDCGSDQDDGISECNPGSQDAEPAFYAPVLTTDPSGNVTVIQGTGNLDRLDDPSAVNRVVSVTEVIEYDEATGEVIRTGDGMSAAWRLNWEITLNRGEQVTGPIQLFGGNAYFATFEAREASSSSCDFGTSQLWGVHYLLNEETVDCDAIEEGECDELCTVENCNTGIHLPIGGLPAGGGTLVRELWPNRLENQLVLGVGITQRQTCSDLQSDITDPFLAGYFRTRIAEQGAGGFELSFQTSGGGEANAGGSIPSQSIELAPPESYTRVAGWASAL